MSESKTTTRLCPSCKKRPCECVTNTVATKPRLDDPKDVEINRLENLCREYGDRLLAAEKMAEALEAYFPTDVAYDTSKHQLMRDALASWRDE